MTEGTMMTSSKTRTAILAVALTLLGLSGCANAVTVADDAGAVTSSSATISLAPQAQDMPGEPVSTASGPAPTIQPETVAATAPATTAAAPATTKATTKATTSTKVSTTKAAATTAPKSTTVPAAPATATKAATAAGVLTLSCTWDGTRVSALAQWSGYPGIVMTVTAPGTSASSGIAVISHRVNGLAGQHGTCSVSAAGQATKYGSA